LRSSFTLPGVRISGPFQPKAYIAIGSNLGDPQANILRAFEKLQSLSVEPLIRSSLWETAPVDCPPGSPFFINAVAVLIPTPGETPESLLVKLQALEKELGRTPKKVMNESRPLDLDLIAFGTEVRSLPELVLPHPRARLRRFVLQPLAEIAPNLILPGDSATIEQLLRGLPADATPPRKLKA
jgi:2-amino-4-hydroxy-6-hydroxymethyldihydropteridine diphosphokinase